MSKILESLLKSHCIFFCFFIFWCILTFLKYLLCQNFSPDLDPYCLLVLLVVTEKPLIKETKIIKQTTGNLSGHSRVVSMTMTRENIHGT